MPNSEYKEGEIVYKYNSSGFRDVEHAEFKPSEVTRIVVLGDSVSEGLGVKAESVFARLLQTGLGDQYEVINVVARALNTPQEVHLLEQEGLKYQPDLVVLNFMLNDCDFYSSLKAARRAEVEHRSRVEMLDISISPSLKRLLKSSAFVFFVHQRVHELKAKLVGMDDKDYYTNLWDNQENRKQVTTAFDRLASLSKQHGFSVTIIVWPLLTNYERYGFRSAHEWVRM
ncbi:MAG: SGNH/GDSL hydrolase family protein, partial [Nitrososphaera sp.]|nr:SGNH/GDSL hydrolase family protein [Nitrososphaera sp.]